MPGEEREKKISLEGNILTTKEEILKTLAKDKPELQRQFKVSKMALFGSYARGDQQPNSDVDILVEVDPSIGLDFVTLAERIEKLLGVSVDLVSSRAESFFRDFMLLFGIAYSFRQRRINLIHSQRKK